MSCVWSSCGHAPDPPPSLPLRRVLSASCIILEYFFSSSGRFFLESIAIPTLYLRACSSMKSAFDSEQAVSTYLAFIVAVVVSSERTRKISNHYSGVDINTLEIHFLPPSSLLRVYCCLVLLLPLILCYSIATYEYLVRILLIVFKKVNTRGQGAKRKEKRQATMVVCYYHASFLFVFFVMLDGFT